MKITRIISLVLALLCASTFAHDGETHDEGKAASVAPGAAPRAEAFSESFELVAQLSGGELSVLIDRYETNEPVLKAQLEVQYKDLKAKAAFHADHGDYSISDKKLIEALGKPGKHPLLFTLVAGEESDLLETTLETHAEEHQHGTTIPWQWILTAAIAAAALLTIAVLRRRQGKPS